MQQQMLTNSIQETMFVLLPEMLCKVSVCASWHIWQQADLPLLQQLEDQEGWTKMPLNMFINNAFLSLSVCGDQKMELYGY
ncbi:hypothetical protein ACS0TY_005349 [Phlomoides rotata]